jgi:hypothetical protein
VREEINNWAGLQYNLFTALGVNLDVKSLYGLVPKEIWQQYEARLKNKAALDALQDVFVSIIEILSARIEDIKHDDGRAISFYSKDREFLTINVTRKNLRIYIHPSSGASFDQNTMFNVEKYRFWNSSFHKKSGKYRAMSIWISDKKYLSGIKEILREIPH